MLFLAGFFLAVLVACDYEAHDTQLFHSLPTGSTGVMFQNDLPLDSDFNIYSYRNYYNGGGVAIADFNKDGLSDLYFTSNKEANRLYLNLGDFRFEDVTELSGVSGSRGWTTGVATADVNGDGWIDLYVTSAGENINATNELFLFTELSPHPDLDSLLVPLFEEKAAQFGLGDQGLSISATFFDFDLDGWLDLYLLNNKDDAIADFNLEFNQRNEISELGGDRIYRNVNGTNFENITQGSGIYSSVIGFSLSATAGYIDNDEWPDLFVANDFFERDYLYRNNRNGTFTDLFDDPSAVRSMSAASMGSDIADLDRDGLMDIYVADMLPLEDSRMKSVTMFEDLTLIENKEKWGYGHQITRNTLLKNRGDLTFAEVGRYAGVEASDWSWAVLAADYDLNGWNDIYITNGLIQDITNLDYLIEISNPEVMRSIISEENVDFDRLIEIIPSVPVPNVMYSGSAPLKFKEVAVEWGLGEPGFSSGAAWGDLDNDGDLDLVVNDVNAPARIYRNQSIEFGAQNWLKLHLKGQTPNHFAIGARVEAWAGGEVWIREHFLQRGFQSSIEPGISIGFGEITQLDSLQIRWPNGEWTKISDPEELKLPFRGVIEQP